MERCERAPAADSSEKFKQRQSTIELQMGLQQCLTGRTHIVNGAAEGVALGVAPAVEVRRQGQLTVQGIVIGKDKDIAIGVGRLAVVAGLGRVGNFARGVAQGSNVLPLIVDAGYFAAAQFGEVMNASELQQRGNAIEETHEQKPVQGRGVLNLGQVGARIQADGGQSEHSGHAEANPVAGRLTMYPEGDPRQHHNQYAGHIDLNSSQTEQIKRGTIYVYMYRYGSPVSRSSQCDA